MELETGQIVILAYAGLVALGGLIGFAKAKSKPSLIAGLVSGGLLLAAFAVSKWDRTDRGYLFGAAVAALLVIVFGIRYLKTKKVMPSGFLLAVSVGVGGYLAWLVYNGNPWA